MFIINHSFFFITVKLHSIDEKGNILDHFVLMFDEKQKKPKNCSYLNIFFSSFCQISFSNMISRGVESVVKRRISPAKKNIKSKTFVYGICIY